MAGRRGIGAAAMAVAVAVMIAAHGARAQEAWIQIEAVRSLAEAEEAARRHGARVPDLAGFSAAGGWYVLAAGPFSPDEARARLDGLRAEGRVPNDAFLTEGDLYRARLWPGGGAPSAPAASEAPRVESAALPLPERVPERVPEPASEAPLDRAAAEAAQVALRGAGFYEGAIDGAFGPESRAAVAAWQAARGHPPTGVLTAAEGAALLAEHEAVFEGLGMARVEDGRAGISVEMPGAVVAFEGHETPFARYASEDGRAMVLLISQEGDRRALEALFEAIQSLDVVPREGRREIEGDRFQIAGRDARTHTRGFARLDDGRIKGLLLVWPAGDEARRARLWERMRASFQALPEGVLTEAQATPAAAQRLDRLAGLALRAPRLARSGVFVDERGAVLTSAEMAQGCGALLIDDAHPAQVAWADARLALLRPSAPLAPPRVAALAPAPARLGAPIAVAGFPFGAALSQASLTHGRIEDRRGPDGEPALERYALVAEAGDAGGPVLGEDGLLRGILLPPPPEGARALPEGVALGVGAQRLAAALGEAGVEVGGADGARALTPERLARQAAEMAVLVTCYD